jgi:hypothetical protein
MSLKWNWHFGVPSQNHIMLSSNEFDVSECCFVASLSSPLFSDVKMEDSETFKTMVQFECRGLEPVDFQPQVRPNAGVMLRKNSSVVLTMGLQKSYIYYKPALSVQNPSL